MGEPSCLFAARGAQIKVSHSSLEVRGSKQLYGAIAAGKGTKLQLESTSMVAEVQGQGGSRKALDGSCIDVYGGGTCEATDCRLAGRGCRQGPGDEPSMVFGVRLGPSDHSTGSAVLVGQHSLHILTLT